MLSFSVDEFLLILENYNMAIWPFQILVYILIGIALIFSFKTTKLAPKIVLSVLAFLWLFNGIVFSFLFWASSHIFGYIFSVFCVLQGILFLYSIKRSDIKVRYPNKTFTIIGILFVLYACIGYQVFGYFLGHIYPVFFPVGLVPCPTTILTFGIFLIINNIPKKYFVIPFIISLSGFMVVYYGIYEDVGLIISGILGSILLIRRNLHLKKER